MNTKLTEAIENLKDLNRIKPVTIFCPKCGEIHLDRGEWKFKPHRTHLCLGCKHEWRIEGEPTRGVSWTLDEARDVIRSLEAASITLGWHFALAGGVLKEGSSMKDLDLIAYPRTSTNSDRANLRFMLRCLGWWLRKSKKEMHKHWKEQGGKDRKHVEVWRTQDGRRVDLFILGDNPGWFGVK